MTSPENTEAPDTQDARKCCEEELEEGTGNIKFGVGVGAVSAASLAIIGVTCPLCWFVAPAMVAAGVHKRHQAKKKLEELDKDDDSKPDLNINWPKPV